MKPKIIKKDGKRYYQVQICDEIRNLPLFKVSPHLEIALFNILGETKLVEKVAKTLAKKLPKNIDVIITPEVKSVCLAYELSKILKVPYIVLRKTLKPYMLNSLSTEVLSITTGKSQLLHLDGKDRKLLTNKNVCLIDDVISTGSTIEGMRKMMKKAKAKIVAESAVFTEGEDDTWKNVISLGHLPLFKS
ncbi:MAG: phosphoribosyltransferase family protein [Candidatus Daviesbacteria bacterium]|nr:phosphoribosyltransferase family protein [Candidatus Daviesbacteria bacterium]